jgi:hypothetical protein
MAFGREMMKPYIPAVAGFASGLGACLVFFVSAGDHVPAAAAVCAGVLLAALVIPAISIVSSYEGSEGPTADLYRWARLAGGASGGTALGVLVFALVAARPIFIAALASVIIVDACVFSFGALARALGKAFRSRTAGALAAGATLVGLVATPFWSKGLLESAMGPWFAKPLVGASPFLAASIPWTTASATWTFDPKVSDVLYRVWVGNDFAVPYPGWVSCAVGHVLAGVIFLAAAELPRMLAARRRAKPERAH